jgi:tRNA A37 threonylcarbamoyladenosine dehydratase
MNERLIPLFKEEGIKKLQNATVAVVGVGGVGGICAITLARSGVGNIIIQDFDIVEESNINRQIVANYNTIGLSKVDVLYNQIKEINPNCNVIKLNSFFDKDNLSLFSYNIDYVIDAIDSFDSKCFLIENCINRNIKFISSMGAAKKIDLSKVEITKLQKTSYDPLAKKLRNKFKNNNFYVVSSTENSKCEELGSYMGVVSTFGIYAAHHVIMQIVGE